MIVVFGSLNADLVFRVPALPRAGETVLTGSYDIIPGGKGANQAYAAAMAGGPTHMCGRIGKDGFGDTLLASLQAAGADISGVERCDAKTGCAAITVDNGGENQIAVAMGANLEATADQVPDAWLTADTVLLTQMEVSAKENWALIGRAKQAGATIILNAAPAGPVPPSVIECLDMLIVNEHESRIVAEAAGVPETDPVRAARSLARGFEITCIVTLGAEGSIACRPDGDWTMGALPVSAVDTTGAGDAYCGVFAASMDSGASFADALRRAAVGASLACTKAGAQTGMATAAEIESRLGDAPQAKRSDG
jgi:ribokinase